MLWLDHIIFGNGYGMKSPYCDNRFYWLVDTTAGRKGGPGALYTFIGGHGAQLASRQWTHPQPGETRTLMGRKFRAFNSTRRGPRVDVSWAMAGMPHAINDANAAIDRLKRDLDSTLMEPTYAQR